ncbi:hypothetical protein FHS85_004939 [Rhodoligotrophos appendicifer]
MCAKMTQERSFMARIRQARNVALNEIGVEIANQISDLDLTANRSCVNGLPRRCLMIIPSAAEIQCDTVRLRTEPEAARKSSGSFDVDGSVAPVQVAIGADCAFAPSEFSWRDVGPGDLPEIWSGSLRPNSIICPASCGDVTHVTR